MSGGNGMMMCTYPHLLHMKVTRDNERRTAGVLDPGGSGSTGGVPLAGRGTGTAHRSRRGHITGSRGRGSAAARGIGSR